MFIMSKLKHVISTDICLIVIVNNIKIQLDDFIVMSNVIHFEFHISYIAVHNLYISC